MELHDELYKTFPVILKVSRRATKNLDAEAQEQIVRRLQQIEDAYRIASLTDNREGMVQAAKGLSVLGEQITVNLREQREGTSSP